MENIEIQEKIKKVNKKLKLNIIIFLIQIVLLVGIWFEMTRDTGSCSGMDPIEIQAHNLQFLSYQGKQKGTQVKALISTIRRNNNEYSDRMITIAFSSNTKKGSPKAVNLSQDMGDPNAEYNYKIKDTTIYFVTFTKDDNDVVDTCEIHVYSDADLNSGK